MTDALKLPFAGEDTVRRLSADLEEPKWLLEDRLDAYRQYAELPIETNNLFTLYVDLRAARWAELETYRETGDAPTVSEVVPEGAAALIEVAEDRVVARAMSDATRAAGVVIDTFANVLRERPELLRDVIDGGVSLPTNDKFAQFARSHSALGLLIHVPRNVALEQPIVVRWSAGQPGKGLISRTVISLGENASARILEEQVPTNAGTLDGAQSLWWGTAEVKLDRGANLSFAGQQDFGQQTLAIVNRHATLAQDAQLRWALASVGAELHKSRIDNRLVGRGSGVNQVEIGFGDGRQLFDLTSYTRHIGAGHHRRPAQQGRLPRPRAWLLQGHDRDPARGQGNRQLPRRVRDADDQTGPQRDHPEPRDRPARRASREPRQLGRPDRRDGDLLPDEPRPSPRCGAQVHRHGLPRAGRGPNSAARGAGSAAPPARAEVAGQSRTAGGMTDAVRRVPVARLEDVPVGTMLMVQVDGTDILLVNIDDELRAVQGVCSHEYFELDKGFLTDNTLTCALHLSRFDLETGEALDPPAELPLQTYPIVLEGDQVLLELPEGPVPVNE